MKDVLSDLELTDNQIFFWMVGSPPNACQARPRNQITRPIFHVTQRLGRQRGLLWEGHSRTDQSYPAHLYCLPLDMAGMIGMAQTLAVYTLKNRQVQSHDPAFLPSDVAAVLEWGLDMPFTSQDKPPLAIAMIATLNGERSFRRYRLVIAQKAKFRSQLWLKPLSVQTVGSHTHK